jgi:hypothetical protein
MAQGKIKAKGKKIIVTMMLLSESFHIEAQKKNTKF